MHVTAKSGGHLLLTGIPGLDEVLGGGLFPRRLYLVEGDAGAGKTTAGLQFLREGAQRDEAGLYLTLTETRSELEQIADSHGWSLDSISVLELAGPKDLEAADQTVFHPSEVELGETARAIIEAVERARPARVVIDSLGEMRLMAQTALRFRRQVLALKQAFQDRGATPILLDEQAGEGGDAQLRSLCHGVLKLEHFFRDYGAERRRLRVIKMRAREYVGGYHDYVIRTGGLSVFPRPKALSQGPPFDAGVVESGVDDLDTMLGGGLDRGTSTLIIGPAGAGKSVVCARYATSVAARGESALYLSFDEGLGTLISRSQKLGMGMQELVQSGRLSLQKVDPAELSPGEFFHLVRRAVEERGVRLVVIDSLNGYLNAMVGERMLALQLHEMLAYLGQRGVLTLLVLGQRGVLGSALHPPANVSYLADTILLFRTYEVEGRRRRAISVMKKRGGGGHDETTRDFAIAGDGIRVGEPVAEFLGESPGRPAVGEPAAIFEGERSQ